MYVPERDEEHEVLFLVRIRSFGKLKDTRRRLSLFLARALDTAFEGRFEFTMLDDGEHRDPGGWVRYDGFADDMGNHPGRTQALIPVCRNERQGTQLNCNNSPVNGDKAQ